MTPLGWTIFYGAAAFCVGFFGPMIVDALTAKSKGRRDMSIKPDPIADLLHRLIEPSWVDADGRVTVPPDRVSQLRVEAATEISRLRYIIGGAMKHLNRSGVRVE